MARRFTRFVVGIIAFDLLMRVITATVPTLVVPLSTTLDPEVESRYKAIKDTKVSAVPCSALTPVYILITS